MTLSPGGSHARPSAGAPVGDPFPLTEQLGLAHDFFHVGGWMWDVVNDRIYAYAALTHYFGVDDADAEGGPIQAYLARRHPDDLPGMQATLGEALATGDTFAAEYRVRGRDGLWRHIAARGRIERDADGRVVRLPGVVMDVTARHEAEVSLAERNAHYSALFESIDEGYCVCQLVLDADGAPADYRFIEINPAFSRHAGLPQTAVGQTARALVPGLEQHWVDTYARAALGRESFRFEQGSAAMGRWFEVYVTPVGTPGERLFGLVFRDITDRHALDEREAELRTLAAELEALYDAAPVALGALRRDDDGSYTYLRANPAFAAIHALTPQELVGRRVDSMLNPELYAAARSIFDEVTRTGEPHLNSELEGESRSTPGNRRRWLASYYPLFPNDDGTYRGVGATSLDITDLRATEAALRVQEERYRLASGATDDLIWDWNVAAGRVDWGPSIATRYGWDEARTGTAYRWWLDRIHPEDRPGVEGLHRRAIGGEADRWSTEYRMAHADGTYAVVFDRGQVLRDDDGTVLRLVGAMFDLTERKQAAEAAEAHSQELERLNASLEARIAARTDDLRRANTALTARNRELQDFAYIASHDLQEPLRKVSMFADLLASEHTADLNPTARDYVGRMQAAALRMSRLIRDLLAYSRVSTTEVDARRVDLDEALDAVLGDLDLRLTESGGRVEAGPLGVVDADPVQVHQLLLNLIGNALKFHRPGVPPVVRVSAYREGPMRRLVVDDNGVGFDEHQSERIFGPFQRLHTRAEYEGTGIGLAIVRRIAERHGGVAVAASTPGEGSRFAVTLPDAR